MKEGEKTSPPRSITRHLTYLKNGGKSGLGTLSGVAQWIELPVFDIR